MISLIILFVLRSTLNTMIVESQTSFDFSNMGYWTKKLASEGKVAEASIVFLISGILFSLILTIIMHFIVKIFKKFVMIIRHFYPKL